MNDLANIGFTDSTRIGFIQGRLSPVRNGRIQSFPWDTWREEFEVASKLSFEKIEWTIDSENFLLNPLLTSIGQEEIIRLKEQYQVEIPSVTCDYFMENPPWTSDPEKLFLAIESILQGMKIIGAKILVIPLVDNSSLSGGLMFSQVELFFGQLSNLLHVNEIKIAFETDLNPVLFSSFMNTFEKEIYGVNYDIGNSAALGFKPTEEFAAIGQRVINVHVKDRVLGGTTVPLGTGDADFLTVFRCLDDLDYVGNLIMQTARVQDGRHAEVLAGYREQITNWIEEAT
jgi:L-ribulose-5-phosphate 3-epimerase